MIGLIFFIIVGFWFYMARFISTKLTGKINHNLTKYIAKFVLTTLLFFLPFMDEIVAKFQFDILCEKHSKVWIDKDAIGKTVYPLPVENVGVKGTWVHVTKQIWKYVDVNTKKVIVEYSSFSAGPGILSRYFSGFLLFNGSCFPEKRPDGVESLLEYGIHYTESPTE